MILDMVACRKSLCSHFSILQDRFSSIFRWISKCIAHGYNRQSCFMLSKTLSIRVNQTHIFCIHQYILNEKYVTEYKRRFWTILWIPRQWLKYEYFIILSYEYFLQVWLYHFRYKSIFTAQHELPWILWSTSSICNGI